MKQARNRGFELDDTDRRILDMLRDDARMSFTDMARGTNYSRVTIRERIDAMEQAGVIKGYSVVIDWSLIKGGYWRNE